MISDSGLQPSDLRKLFVEAVWASHELPLPLREHATEVVGLDVSQFDWTYLAFLDEQIALSPRGPEWTARLMRRRAGLASFCDLPLLNGRVLAGSTEYTVKVDPATKAVVYWEEYSDARSTSVGAADVKSEI
jgi:hypothetical protein